MGFNKKISSNRWFIWTIVLIVIIGVSLWAFIEYESMRMEAWSTEESVNIIITIKKDLSDVSGTIEVIN